MPYIPPPDPEEYEPLHGPDGLPLPDVDWPPPGLALRLARDARRDRARERGLDQLKQVVDN